MTLEVRTVTIAGESSSPLRIPCKPRKRINWVIVWDFPESADPNKNSTMPPTKNHLRPN